MDVRCTALAWLVTAVMPAFVGAQSPSTVAPFKSPSDLLKGRQFAELEQRATQAWESRARDVDGKFQFGELTSALYEHFESMARVFPPNGKSVPRAPRCCRWRKP